MWKLSLRLRVGGKAVTKIHSTRQYLHAPTVLLTREHEVRIALSYVTTHTHTHTCTHTFIHKHTHTHRLKS